MNGLAKDLVRWSEKKCGEDTVQNQFTIHDDFLFNI
jgi:hypothetical protein